ncbi:hypothetical protein [Halobellus salinisoli]|uniref:hypothetical protein n=1 Tax=Halobellus salinisoli TaxID=3108500 RepID=UPI0030091A91
MSDDFPDAGDSTPTATSFEEWLDQHAASQGISREELFERLVSSYWTLNELTQLLDDSGGRNHPFEDETVSGAEKPAEFDADAIRREKKARHEDRRADTSTEERPDGDLESQFESLKERVDDLQAEVEAETERGQSLGDVTEAVATRLAEIEAELDEVTTTAETTRESLTEQYESLRTRVDSLESVVDRKHQQVASEQSELASEQEQLRSWIDAEFENLETILKYLVSQTDELETDIASAENRSREALSNLRWERDALQSVKRDAAALGVHEGICESCEATIDLDLLSRPYCPHCENSVSGVEKRKKWLFLSDAIVTTDSETRDGNTPDSPRSAEVPAHSPADSPDDPPERVSRQRQSPRSNAGGQSGQGGGIPVEDSLSDTDGSDPGDDEQFGHGVSAESAADRGATDERESASPFEFDSEDLGDGDDGENAGSSQSDSPFGDLSELERNERS